MNEDQSNVKSAPASLTPHLIAGLIDADLLPYQQKFIDMLVIGVDLASEPDKTAEVMVYPKINGKQGYVIVDEYTAAPPRQLDPAFWVTRRNEVFQAAERYLKARGILVSVVDREAWVRTYRVTGQRSPLYLESVVALAQHLGFEVPGE